MRCIREGKAYDTQTGDPIKEVGGDEREEWVHRLYRTRNGMFFLFEAGPVPVWEQPDQYNNVECITPLSDEVAKKWLACHASELVEKYFGEMPEAGAAERRFTLRLPNNLGARLEAIAQSKDL